jgi:AcrR family transcriptional regulator
MTPGPSLRQTLVDHAMRLLEAGEHDPSLRAVARAAGVSAMAPYRHFPDKAALLGAVAAEGFATLHGLLVAADDRGSAAAPEQALIEQGLAYVGFAQAHPALFRLMFTDAITATAHVSPDRAAEGDAYGVLAGRVATLCPGSAATATMAAWALVHGFAMLALDRRLPPEPEAARAALAMFVVGLTKKGPEA